MPTVAAGVVWVARLTVSAAEANDATGSAAVPSYASNVMVDLVVAENATAAFVPASFAAATLL